MLYHRKINPGLISQGLAVVQGGSTLTRNTNKRHIFKRSSCFRDSHRLGVSQAQSPVVLSPEFASPWSQPSLSGCLILCRCLKFDSPTLQKTFSLKNITKVDKLLKQSIICGKATIFCFTKKKTHAARTVRLSSTAVYISFGERPLFVFFSCGTRLWLGPWNFAAKHRDLIWMHRRKQYAQSSAWNSIGDAQNYCLKVYVLERGN